MCKSSPRQYLYCLCTVVNTVSFVKATMCRISQAALNADKLYVNDKSELRLTAGTCSARNRTSNMNSGDSRSMFPVLGIMKTSGQETTPLHKENVMIGFGVHWPDLHDDKKSSNRKIALICHISSSSYFKCSLTSFDLWNGQFVSILQTGVEITAEFNIFSWISVVQTIFKTLNVDHALFANFHLRDIRR